MYSNSTAIAAPRASPVSLSIPVHVKKIEKTSIYLSLSLPSLSFVCLLALRYLSSDYAALVSAYTKFSREPGYQILAMLIAR